MQPNKNRTLDEGIFASYQKVYTENSEEHLSPENRVHSHEAPRPGEYGGESQSESLQVHVVHILDGKPPKVLDSCVITPEDWCPECCINELFEHEGEHMLTADDMTRDYKVAFTSTAIFIAKNDGTDIFTFVKV